MAANIHQAVIDGGKLLLQTPGHLARGVGGGIGGVCLNEVNHGFRLGQVQLPVQESPLGEFSPLSRPRPCQIQGLEPRRQYSGGAVAVKFHGVLPGVAVGATGHHGHALVYDPALLVVESACT